MERYSNELYRIIHSINRRFNKKGINSTNDSSINLVKRVK